MSDKTKALAEQYVSGYKSKSEMSNWDDVIEIGLKLAQEVIAEQKNTERLAQPAPLERDELIQRLKYSIPSLEKKIMMGGLPGVGKGGIYHSQIDNGGTAFIPADLDATLNISVIPNDEEIKLANEGKFTLAVRSLCTRTNCTNKAGRAALEPYRKF